VEVISPNDTLNEQRLKMAMWINAGVEVRSYCPYLNNILFEQVGMLIDYLHFNTYLYASTVSGLLPLANPNVSLHFNDPGNFFLLLAILILR
jgi:hypothetical protein